MESGSFDLIVAGGGLAGGLLAYRYKQTHAASRVLIVEAGPSLGGNHTWSFHEDDLTAPQREWMRPFVSRSWPAYDVAFPEFRRTVSSAYHSVRSDQFHRVLSEQARCEFRLARPVRGVEPGRVVLNGGETFFAPIVLDARGWENDARVPCAYQKFLGIDVTLRSPHGLTRPLLMDATVEQRREFRFFYVLPWNDRSLLIEDTRYGDDPAVDAARGEAEIIDYAARRGWTVASVDRRETGALAIPLEGALPAWPGRVARIGARAGLFHATTGYSLPNAVRFADRFSSETLAPERVFEWAWSGASAHWAGEKFSRLLNRLLFRAAEPAERYRVLEKFYRLPEDLIRRFYAGRLTSFDRVRVLSGKPPVPIRRALSCIFEKRKVNV